MRSGQIIRKFSEGTDIQVAQVMGNKATGITAPRACPCNDLLADAGSCRAVPNIGKVTHQGEKIQQ